MKKNLKDGAYYWVRQQPTTEPSGHSKYPHWEPMLWSQGRFWHRGLPPNGPGIAKEDLADIGEILERRRKRTTRKGYIATIIDRAGRKADPVYDVIHNSSKAATRAGTGLPVPVEVSWENADFSFANGFARNCCAPRKEVTVPQTTGEREGGHAESCPAVNGPAGRACTCSGGDYVWSGRGARQLGAYDG